MKIGIDEAGRGPVIGPMVICAFSVLDKKLEEMSELFSKLNIKDSKKLTPEKREKIFQEFLKLKNTNDIDFETIIIPPNEIDSAVESKTMNLNKLEIIKNVELILRILQKYNELNEEVNIYIDCPSNNIRSFIQEFFYFFNQDYSIISEKKDEITITLNLQKKINIFFAHKADEKYKIVSAASIVAKVMRDNIIEEIKKSINFDFGSGYPADERTIDFLEKNYNKYDFFRKSWDSWKRVNNKNKNNEENNNKQSNLKKFIN
ncbi:MAG: ribonuclease HII [Candidatus Woesearchaeota archaeon]